MSENEHVTDPPQAKQTRRREEPKSELSTRTVFVTSNGGHSLPSGATYLLQAGTHLELTPDDAQYLEDNGLAESV